MRQPIVTPELLADLRRYNAGISRARHAYYADPTEQQQQAAQDKAVRKAAAQSRYRAKKRKTP